METIILGKNAVHSPAHYASGKIEVAEAIEDWGLDFRRGNAVKYIARAGRKDPTKEIEDLEKALWYTRRAIELKQAEQEGREPKRPNEMVGAKTVSRPPDSELFSIAGAWREVELENGAKTWAFFPFDYQIGRQHQDNIQILVRTK